MILPVAKRPGPDEFVARGWSKLVTP